jgi:hypothetical protein
MDKQEATEHQAAPVSEAGPQRLSRLGRTDKYVLSNAQRLIYAPTHPRYVHKPGLWDEAHFYNHPIGPLVTLSIVNDRGVELPLKRTSTHWRPDRLLREFSDEDGVCLVSETARMMADDTIRITWTIQRKPGFENAVIWTAVGNGPHRDSDQGKPSNRPLKGQTHTNGFSCSLESTFETLHQPALTLSANWASQARTPSSAAVVASQGRRPEPRFDQTPFFDSFDGRLIGPGRVDAPETSSILFAGMHFDLNDDAETLSIDLALTCPAFQEPTSTQTGLDWSDFFDQSPSFLSSNPHFNAYFDYRLFGLRMNSIPGGTACIPHPAVCEGPGYFRAPITYSAQCHILETRWFSSGALAQGSLLNFIHNQQEDGRYIGYLGPSSLPGEFFYHANWGRILELDAVHPDASFLAVAYESLVRYVDFFDRERDPESSGLYDILNHYETGQEYMHRYVAVESSADLKHWGNVFRLKGVDVSVYLYQIKRALQEMATRAGLTEEAARWDMSAQKSGRAILDLMWDPESEMFSDIDPATGKRTGVKAAVCFYPYLTDLVDASHLPGLKAHLFNEAEFWTTYPVPSSSADDPFYNADGLWKGERKNCPWNGRVWPMTNSHVAEVLATCAARFDDDELRTRGAEFITKYIEMMFFDGDPARPNSFEHYHPENGRPSVFRGVDDYQHSWILDLIIRYVAGVSPTQSGVHLNPMPFELEHFDLNNIRIRGCTLSVSRKGTRCEARWNDDPVVSFDLGNPVFLAYPE